MPDESGHRTTPMTFMLPRQWGPRIAERVFRHNYDDASAWARYHLGRALDAPEIEVPVPTGPEAYRDVARRLTQAITALREAATVIENVAQAYADADGRVWASDAAEQLRARAADLSA